MAIAFVAMAALTWRKWPDLLVDFGQQLYIPWRLSVGERLYRDIAFMHGPFSQHFNALWFWAFGPSLSILIALNLAILASTTALVYVAVHRMSDHLTAALSGLILLLVFAFSQYVGTGNYNDVTPYVHEATHGIAFSLGLIVLLIRFADRGGRAVIAGAGICLGLTLLTKVDVATAAIAVSVVGLAAIWLVGRADGRLGARDLAAFVAGAAAPVALFFVYLATYLPMAAAFKAVFGGFFAVSGKVAKNAFYLRTIGFDDVSGNLWLMLGMTLAIAAFVVAVGLVNVFVSRRLKASLVVPSILGAIVAWILIATPDLVNWPELPRALPLVTGIAIVVFAVSAWRASDRIAALKNYLPTLLWAVFALALLAKIVLNTHVFSYGFYLAMPATLLLVVCLTFWLPRALAARFGSGEAFRMIAIGALVAFGVYQFNWSQRVYAPKDYSIGADGDRIVAYAPDVFPPTGVTAEALRWIDANMPKSATFVALPEGITLNYLTRRPTTVPVINFMMTEMIVFGEDAMVASFQAHPPDYVLLVDKDTSEFGVGAFGVDPNYGRRIMTWVDQHYDEAALFGAEPFRGRGFGIKILKRTR